MNIEKVFTYQKPNPQQIEDYFALREKAKELAYMIIGKCPQSHEQTQAIDKLRECIMWANTAIAMNERS